MSNFLTKMFGIDRLTSKSYKRGYQAAASKARYGDMGSSRGSADYELRGGLAVIRAKSRWLERNSSSIRRFLRLMKINVVGHNGFIFQSRVRKLDGSLDKTLNSRVQKEWVDWCETPTVDGKMTMVDLQEQCVQTLARDGEVIWEIVKSRKYKDGISVNPIEADYLDHTLNTNHKGSGNQIKMGVEVDDYGRPIAYHLLTSHPGDATWYSYDHRQRYRRVLAKNIIHTFERTRPGQTRGEPWTVTTINSVKMLDGYREAETMGRRVRSIVGGWFERLLPGTQGISDLADDVDKVDDLFEMSLEPGTFKELPPGITFKQFDPGGSQTDYADFDTQVKKDISMGVGISALSHGMETSGVSYSAGRLVKTEDQDMYKTVQALIIRLNMKPLFTLWLSMRILQEESTVPPTRMKSIRESCKFRPRGWQAFDPSKDNKANTEALASKQKSLTEVAAEKGRDIDELLHEIAVEKELAAEYGLTLDYNIGKQSATNSTKGEKDDDDEDE